MSVADSTTIKNNDVFIWSVGNDSSTRVLLVGMSLTSMQPAQSRGGMVQRQRVTSRLAWGCCG